MSKTHNSNFLNMLSNLSRDNARASKMQARDNVALLDVLASDDDDMIEALDLRDSIAREYASHSH